MPVHTQTHANAGAPGDVGAIGQGVPAGLQSTPTPLGLQSTNAIVFYPHSGEGLTQRCLQQSGVPCVGQTPCGASQTTTDIGSRQLDHPLIQHKGAARGHADRANGGGFHARQLAALPHHANDLACQRTVVTFFGRGLCNAAPKALIVHEVDRHFGAPNVHAGHGRSTTRQLKPVGQHIWSHSLFVMSGDGRRQW